MCRECSAGERRRLKRGVAREDVGGGRASEGWVCEGGVEGRGREGHQSRLGDTQ